MMKPRTERMENGIGKMPSKQGCSESFPSLCVCFQCGESNFFLAFNYFLNQLSVLNLGLTWEVVPRKCLTALLGSFCLNPSKGHTFPEDEWNQTLRGCRPAESRKCPCIPSLSGAFRSPSIYFLQKNRSQWRADTVVTHLHTCDN